MQKIFQRSRNLYTRGRGKEILPLKLSGSKRRRGHHFLLSCLFTFSPIGVAKPQTHHLRAAGDKNAQICAPAIHAAPAPWLASGDCESTVVEDPFR